MDPQRFDALSRAVAGGLSRRGALARLGAGGLGAGGPGRCAACLALALLALLAAGLGPVPRPGAALLGLGGRGGHGGAAPAAHAQGDATCSLSLVANVRVGPSSSSSLGGTTLAELRGTLAFGLDRDGGLTAATFRFDDGTAVPAVGQATGRALNVRFTVGHGQSVVLVGTAQNDLAECTGPAGGLFTGPQVGDLGDWHAVAGPLSGGTGAAPSAAGAFPAGAPSAPPPPPPSSNASEYPSPSPSSSESGSASSELELCPEGLSPCAGGCIDLMTDDLNCGACGKDCTDTGADCVDGACIGGGGGQDCAANELTDCNGDCVDLNSDSFNCGACGNSCFALGLSCVDGLCVDPCPASQTDCGGACVNLQADNGNCGGCGVVCGTGLRCSGGVCDIIVN